MYRREGKAGSTMALASCIAPLIVLLFCCLLLWADRTFSLLVPKCENSSGHWLPVFAQISPLLAGFCPLSSFYKLTTLPSAPVLASSSPWNVEKSTTDCGLLGPVT